MKSIYVPLCLLCVSMFNNFLHSVSQSVIFITAILSITFQTPSYSQIYLPIAVPDRQDNSNLNLTQIGQFGILRKARPKVPSHFHTGIDIKRPVSNYSNEPIFPIASGKVISKRTDGPYAQLIVEHKIRNLIFWSVYEHIAGITANVNDVVNPNEPIARFMNRQELDKYGWQFDHFHLEVIKIKPTLLKPDKLHPQRFYNSYSLVCYRKEDLIKYFYNPVEFFKEMWFSKSCGVMQSCAEFLHRFTSG